jgi:hypothetical protein
MMMKSSGIFPTALMATAMMVVMLCLGCEKEGPAERAGRQLDDAAADVGATLEDAGEDIKKAVDGTR